MRGSGKRAIIERAGGEASKRNEGWPERGHISTTGIKEGPAGAEGAGGGGEKGKGGGRGE